MPPTWYWVALFAVAAGTLVLRLTLGRPLLPRRARTVGRADIALAIVALLALGFHCAAMFFTDTITVLAGSEGAVSSINALGLESKLAYAIPAALLVVALRSVGSPGLVGLAVALLAVGVTMYWWLGLWVHLTAIAASISVLALIASSLVRIGDVNAPGESVQPAGA